jgi:hypothetical protein
LKKFKLYLTFIGIIAVVFLMFFSYNYFVGLTPSRQAEIKHFKSDLIGLKRVIEQYDANGRIINRYEGRYKIEIEGSFISFIHEGKNIKLSGTIQIREVD